MGTTQTKNARTVTVVVIETADSAIETIPTAPYGSLIVTNEKKLEKKVWPKLATRLAESGCEWATLHAGKNTERLHDLFDEAIVSWQLTEDSDSEMNTSGDNEDNLEEAMRDAVYYGHPSYGEPYPNLLIVVVGTELDGLDARAESLAGSVEK
ncbi:MAG: hypothetical protein ACYTDT_08810 [Planctomycetota bacterium]|jgi:hypothetical protein